MAEVIKYKADDFLRRVKMLSEAEDQYGNRLYSDTEVAASLGLESVDALNKTMAKARTMHRNDLIRQARALKKEGFSIDKIAGRMKLTGETVAVLLDEDYETRMEAINDRNNQRSTALRRMLEMYSIDEILRKD